jgi:predicted DNA-binding mobile mystery protein A
MSTTDLSNRLKVTPSTVHRLEKSEIAGTINLESLKKVAEELGCELVYALVPRQDLELVVKKRAFELATEKLKQTQSTMALEQQELQVDVLNKLIEQKARELVESRELWKAAVKDVR